MVSHANSCSGSTAVPPSKGAPVRRFVLAGTLLLATSLFAAANYARADSLEVQLKLASTEFVYGQEIYAEIKLINLTADSLTILTTWDPGYLIVVDENDKRVSHLGLHIRRGPGMATEVLAPHDTAVELREVYSNYYLAGDALRGAAAPTIGKQVLRARFGNLESNVDTLSLMETDPANAGILDALIRANSSWFEPQMHQDIVSQLSEVLQKNPNSIYKAELLSTLERFARFIHNDSLEFYLSRRLVAECPDHIRAWSALSRLVSGMSSNDARDYLDSVAVGYPNSRIVIWVREYKKRLGIN